MIRTLARTLCLFLALCAGAAHAAPLTGEALAPLIVPPYALGQPVNDQGVWQLLNSGGAEAGYVFETEPLAQIDYVAVVDNETLEPIERIGENAVLIAVAVCSACAVLISALIGLRTSSVARSAFLAGTFHGCLFIALFFCSFICAFA